MNPSIINKKGFTLVEIMIVVLIIGILAAMAYPAFIQVVTHSQATRVGNDFRTFSGIFQTYALDNGTYPADASPGVVPIGMDGYFKSGNWTETTPIGGHYDWVNTSSSSDISTAIAISGYTSGDDPVLKLDELLDDGDLSTGSITKSGSILAYMVE